MTRSAIGEYHFTTRTQHWLGVISHCVFSMAVLTLLVFAYLFAQLREENARLHEAQSIDSARGCPSQWRGLPFLFSAEEDLNILRPGTVRIACYYKAGVKT